MFQQNIEYLKYLISPFKSNWRAAAIGSLATFVAIWMLVNNAGISLRSLNKFLISQQKERQTVATQLTAINELIDIAEGASYQYQQEVIKIVQRLDKSNSDKIEGEIDFRKILNLSSESQDVIRALIIFGGIYAKLVTANSHDEKTHKHLSNLYSALLEITLDNPLAGSDFNSGWARNAARKGRISLCDTFKGEHICKAQRLLENVERNIDHFPVEFRDDVEIEVLRYLTYCAARSLETDKQKTYTDTAENILKKILEEERRKAEILMPKANPKREEFERDRKTRAENEYRSKYYWIHYSRLLSIVGKQKPGFEKEATKYFLELRKRLGTQREFLRLKLIQHKGLMKDDDQDDSDCTNPVGTKQKTWCDFINEGHRN